MAGSRQEVGERGRRRPPAPPGGGDGRACLERHLLEELPALRAFVRANVSADLRARESCSDLVHSVCRELLAADGDYVEDRGPEAFRAWMFRWALNKIRDRARFHRAARRAPRRESPDVELAALYASVCSPSAGAIGRESVELFERAMDELREEDRLVVSMCRIVGLSHEEVARELGKTAGAVRTQLHRALVRLGCALERVGVGRDEST